MTPDADPAVRRAVGVALVRDYVRRGGNPHVFKIGGGVPCRSGRTLTAPEKADCVLWEGARDRDGYGRLPSGEGAHRDAYRKRFGEIAPGLVVHHLCGARACVNPEHLVLVTPSEHNRLHQNWRKGQALGAAFQRNKTHCKQGHAFTPENTYVRQNGKRVCRACGRASAKRYHEAAKRKKGLVT